MQLEDYFEFDAPNDRIRIKGSQLIIDVIIDHFKEGMFPEMIVRAYYPSVTLEQVYATITYYLNKKDEVEQYMARVKQQAKQAYQEYLAQPPSPLRQRFLALKVAQTTVPSSS